MILIYIVTAAAVFAAAVSLICFFMAFYAPRQPLPGPEEFPTPEGAAYDPYRARMEQWIRQLRALPAETLTVTSADGLKLFASYYEFAPGAPIEIMFHGYRGSAERDLSGGVQRAFRLGHSVLLADQRTSCRSEGRVITFGLRESDDCRRWVQCCIRRFGPKAQLILTGISMGAATVLMACARPLPPQVKAVLADCGYTSAREMIEKTVAERRLPVKLSYPFVRLGAMVWGGFDPDRARPIDAVRHSAVPTVFFHGEADSFVPCRMSRQLFDACAAPKALLTVPGADHGLSYPADPEGYLHAAADFFSAQGLPTRLRPPEEEHT